VPTIRQCPASSGNGSGRTIKPNDRTSSTVNRHTRQPAGDRFCNRSRFKSCRGEVSTARVTDSPSSPSLRRIRTLVARNPPSERGTTLSGAISGGWSLRRRNSSSRIWSVPSIRASPLRGYRSPLGQESYDSTKVTRRRFDVLRGVCFVQIRKCHSTVGKNVQVHRCFPIAPAK